MEKKQYIRDLYRFEGFRARATIKPHPEDSNGWVITLDRRQKKQFVQHAAQRYSVLGIADCIRCGTWMLAQRTFILSLNIAVWTAHGVEP
jgi:succinate dehydrogenase/fumarate reductase-like Fe-S protein